MNALTSWQTRWTRDPCTWRSFRRLFIQAMISVSYYVSATTSFALFNSPNNPMMLVGLLCQCRDEVKREANIPKSLAMTWRNQDSDADSQSPRTYLSSSLSSSFSPFTRDTVSCPYYYLGTMCPCPLCNRNHSATSSPKTTKEQHTQL